MSNLKNISEIGFLDVGKSIVKKDTGCSYKITHIENNMLYIKQINGFGTSFKISEIPTLFNWES